MHVTPKTPKESKTTEKLLKTYTSSIGNQSLIFNPKQYMILRGRRENTAEALIPSTLFYRFSALLSSVYQHMGSKDLYTRKDSTWYIDQNVAIKYGRRMSTFRDTLYIVPTVYRNDRTEEMGPGIEFMLNNVQIGAMSAPEAIGMIDTLDHLDISTYTLMAGMLEKLDDIDWKVDKLLSYFGSMPARHMHYTPEPTTPARTGRRESSLGWMNANPVQKGGTGNGEG